MQRIPKINAFFSKQKSSETWELEVDEEKNRPSSFYTVIDFIEQSESRQSASISSAKKQITHVSESEIHILLRMTTPSSMAASRFKYNT